ncbi:zeta toxin family protein [Streptomyces sp. NPDC002276]
MTDERPPRLLSDDQLREIFDADIRPTLAGPAHDEPRVLILGGSQGSGKTSALPLIAQQLDMPQAFRFEGDDILRVHPQFEPIARDHGVMEAYQRTGQDYTELVRMTLEELRDLRRDTILVGPYTDPNATFGRIAEFTAVGYRPEAAYMAVHPARSQLGVLHRHHQALADGIDYSFAVPLELQQRIYENTPLIMAQAQRENRVEALHVSDRTGIVLSTRRQPDGTWAPPVDIRQAVEDHRSRPWDRETRADFTRRRDEIRPTLTGAEWAERLASVDRLAAPMLGGTGQRQSVANAAVSRSTTVAQDTSLSASPSTAADRPRPTHTDGQDRSPGRSR